MNYTGFHTALEIDHRAQKLDSWQIHLCNEIEASAIERLREDYRKKGLDLPSYTAILIQAIALGIEELSPRFPELNSFLRRSLFGKSIHSFGEISAGSSVALKDESAIIVGVIAEPQKKTLTEITQALSGMANPAYPVHAKALRYYGLPKFLQIPLFWMAKNSPRIRYETRGTFSITPVGKFGIDVHLTLPQTASLQFGMGAVRDRVIAKEGKPVVAKTFFLTVCFDRRLMNARPCALLMQRVRERLQSADLLL